MTVDFGLALTPGPLPDYIDTWLEDLEVVLPRLQGHIQSLWMPDHFFWGTMPTYEAMTVLTYLAARFPEFDVGSSVLGQSYRNPAYLAKTAATLQTLTRGRFILGLGAGWKEDEYHAYNYPYPNVRIRLEQLEDTLQIVRRLWNTPGPVTFEGKYYRVQEAYCEPRPDPAPPILVGGGGKTTMLHAARYADWWNISDVDVNVFKERLDILHQHCETIGREFSSIRKTWFGRLVLGETEAEARQRGQEKGRSHYDGWTLEGALLGTPEQVTEQIAAFINLGVDYFMLEILDIESPDIQRMVIEQVISQFSA